MGSSPILVELDVSTDDRRHIVERAISMNDPEVVERVLVLSVQRLPKWVENGLESIVKPRGEEFSRNNVRVPDVSSRVDCFVMIRIAVIDVGSWIAH
jgi:hypothetical protein